MLLPLELIKTVAEKQLPQNNLRGDQISLGKLRMKNFTEVLRGVEGMKADGKANKSVAYVVQVLLINIDGSLAVK